MFFFFFAVKSMDFYSVLLEQCFSDCTQAIFVVYVPVWVIIYYAYLQNFARKSNLAATDMRPLLVSRKNNVREKT